MSKRAWPNRLAEHRARNGLNQQDAAARLEISLRQYQNWEAGVARPRAETRYKLAQAFGVDIADLDAPALPEPQSFDEELLANLLDRVRDLEARIAELERWRVS